jgi:hypothetical protein
MSVCAGCMILVSSGAASLDCVSRKIHAALLTPISLNFGSALASLIEVQRLICVDVCLRGLHDVFSFGAASQ